MIPSKNDPLGYRFFESGGFPDSYEGCLFKTDFRVWLRYSFIMDSKELSEIEKVNAVLNLCYAAIIPNISTETLHKGVMWFYQCGETDKISLLENSITNKEEFYNDIKEINAKRRKNKTFDCFWDYKEVWASFKVAYKIDLYKIKELHWWGFASLLSGLDSESPVGKLIRLREKPKNPTREEFIEYQLAALPQETEEDDDI